ncbi:hypothetical protein [Frankia sp. Cj3]|uniref:hypothetical protein n=1 Tax=Frankia sp. Cj3 TaxID=2880976 RepID=UPI001EF6236E|nr:hypothetical protein [Frankia sp. Cj3]
MSDQVPFLELVVCSKCRRRRGAQFHATGAVEPVPDEGTCPHGKPLRTVWAPGCGPDADTEPPPGSGRDARPPV